MADLLLCGYFGSGNLGDELILSAIQKNFHSGVRTFTAKPSSFFSLKFLFQFTRLIFQRRRAALFPGGEIFQERTSLRNIKAWSFFVFILRFLRIPVFFSGQAVQNDIRDPLNRKLVRKVFHSAAYVRYRDSLPGDPLLPNTSAAPDPVFTSNLNERKDQISKTVLLCLKHGLDINVLKAFSEIILQECPDHEFWFMPFHQKQDMSLWPELVRFFPQNKLRKREWGGEPSNGLKIFSEADFCVCMRYHSAVLALLYNKKFITLETDNRLQPLLDPIGMRNRTCSGDWFDPLKSRAILKNALKMSVEYFGITDQIQKKAGQAHSSLQTALEKLLGKL